MYEVEIKAWIDDLVRVEAVVTTFARFLESYEKRDVYYRSPSGDRPREFRLRVQEGRGTVTFKEKSVRDGIELNRESEFGVSDATFFDRLMQEIGCVRFLEKVKRGRAYTFDGIRIEVGIVEHLGAFVEIEELVESDEPAVLEAARGRVRKVLDECGVEESRIEGRYYTDLLLERPAGP